MFFNYMPYNPNTKAFLAWRQCIQNDREVRKELTLPLPKNKEEHMRMCRSKYKAYMKLENKRKELQIEE